MDVNQFDQLVLSLLKGTLSTNADSRLSSEAQLKALESREDLPASLARIGANMQIIEQQRMSALYALNRYVPRLWSPMQEDYEEGMVTLSTETCHFVRATLLEIVFRQQVSAKIMNATAAVVATVAKSDFPEEWPSLMDDLLQSVQHASDDQADVVCTVLKELMRDALDEEQFYRYADSLVGTLRLIATDNNRRPTTRASAVAAFGECFSFVQNLMETQAESMANFAKNVCSIWLPFLQSVVEAPMPQFPSDEEDDDETSSVTREWRGSVALKRAVVVVLMKIQDSFPETMPAQALFNATWQAVQTHAAPYYSSFIAGDRQGNMISSAGVAYTIDLLIIEEIDYMEALFEAPEVRNSLDNLLATDPDALKGWVLSVLNILVTFSCIPHEAEEMWIMDCNIFLTEETFAEANSTPRSLCASFMWKLSNRYPVQAVQSVQQVLSDVLGNAASDWRQKEAVLYNVQQVAEEYDNESRDLDHGVVNSLIAQVEPLLNDANELLRARAQTVMAASIGAWFKNEGANLDLAAEMTRRCVQAVSDDQSDVVKVACIRVISDYLSVLTGTQSTELQASIVAAIGNFLDAGRLSNPDEVSELVDTALQTLRDTVMANPLACLEIRALDVILNLVKFGAARESHSAVLIDEAFTSAAEAMAEHGSDAYSSFCSQILPSLVAGLDINPSEPQADNVLVDVSVSLIKVLAESARAPLPPSFVPATIPRLRRLINKDTDFYLMQSATLTVKEIVSNDSGQVFNWVDQQTQQSGLQICLEMISLLLGDDVSEASAAEVGELANVVVEKAGEALAGSMQEMIAVLAKRLAQASHPQLIQSLVMVFARLAIKYAAELIMFLDSTPVLNHEDTALTIVLRKWLDNSTTFAGFDTIRQNMQALVTIYTLSDARIDAIIVNGDMIPDTNTRIRTRSQAALRPIRYEQISATLKIVKLIVGELVLDNDGHGGLPLKSPAVTATPRAPRHGDDDDSDWEDEDDDAVFAQRVSDDSTQRYLVEFMQSQAQDPRFQGLYSAMNEEEKQRGRKAVEQYQAMQAQRIQLGAVPRG